FFFLTLFPPALSTLSLHDALPIFRFGISDCRAILAAMVRRRKSPPYWNFIIQRLRLKTPTAAFRAGRVGAVTAEQHAHVHFIGLALEPAEKTAHPVPAIILVFVLAIIASLLALDDKLLIGLGQFVERNVDIDLFSRAGPQQI